MAGVGTVTFERPVESSKDRVLEILDRYPELRELFYIEWSRQHAEGFPTPRDENGKPIPLRPNPVYGRSDGDSHNDPPGGCALYVVAVWAFVIGLVVGMNWL